MLLAAAAAAAVISAMSDCCLFPCCTRVCLEHRERSCCCLHTPGTVREICFFVVCVFCCLFSLISTSTCSACTLPCWPTQQQQQHRVSSVTPLVCLPPLPVAPSPSHPAQQKMHSEKRNLCVLYVCLRCFGFVFIACFVWPRLVIRMMLNYHHSHFRTRGFKSQNSNNNSTTTSDQLSQNKQTISSRSLTHSN